MYHLREAESKCFQFSVLPLQHQLVAPRGFLSPWRGTRGPKVSGTGGIEGLGRRAEEAGTGGGGQEGATCSCADPEEVKWAGPARRLLPWGCRERPPPTPRRLPRSGRAVLPVVCGLRVGSQNHSRQETRPQPLGLCVPRCAPRHPRAQAPGPGTSLVRAAAQFPLPEDSPSCPPMPRPHALRPAFRGEAGRPV